MQELGFCCPVLSSGAQHHRKHATAGHRTTCVITVTPFVHASARPVCHSLRLFVMQQQQQTTCRAGLVAGWLHPAWLGDALCVGSSSDQRHFVAIRRRRARTPAGSQHLLRQPVTGAPAPEPSAGAFRQGECIEVEASFDAAEGAALPGGQLVVGRHIGSGSAADVYQLTTTSSSSRSGGGGDAAKTAPDAAAPGQVLKWIKPVPGLRRAFKREWMIGRRLNAAALAEPALGILLQTGPAVVSRAGKGGKGDVKASSSGHGLVFRGAVLQALAGQSLDKRLEADGSFCDIDYLTACLQAVLTALDRGAALVGFEHGDLRISNIMEHAPDPEALQRLSDDSHAWRAAGHESAASAALASGLLTFKLLDFGHSRLHESRSRNLLLKVQQEAAADVEAGRSRPAIELCSGSLALQHLPEERGPLEAFYRFWYRGKSDAWRLLRSLATRLDGRAWPQRRRASVAALYEMIEALLGGLRLQVRFFDDTEVGPDGTVRRLGSSEYVADEPPASLGRLLGGGSGSGGTPRFVRVGEVPGLDVTARPRRFRLLRALRERLLRLVSRLFARRPRVTAREVLREMGKRGLLLQVVPAGQ